MADQEFTEEELAREEWRPVLGHEDKYDVSTLGRLRSRDRLIVDSRGRERHLTPRILDRRTVPGRAVRDSLNATMDLDGEQWRSLPGYPNYVVSNFGRVKNVMRGRFVSQYLYRKGLDYKAVSVWREGRSTVLGVHRAVALAFFGEPPSPKHHAAHKDGKASNNIVDNLYWATPTENGADRKRHGTQLCGEQVPVSKLSNEAVLAIRAASAAGVKSSALARKYNVTFQTINKIVKRKTWSHI